MTVPSPQGTRRRVPGLPSREILLFLVSGGLGFLVDASVVQVLVSLFDVNPYASRVVSFLCAASATWAFNRRYTFAGKRRYASARGELARYLVAMVGGFAINYGTFVAVLAAMPVAHRWPVIGVAAGSLAGAVLNYLTSKFWIFRAPSDSSTRPPA